MEQRDVLKSH